MIKYLTKKQKEAEQAKAYDEYTERQNAREIDNSIVPLPKKKEKKTIKERIISFRKKKKEIEVEEDQSINDIEVKEEEHFKTIKEVAEIIGKNNNATNE